MSKINERDKNNIYECISELVQMESADDVRAVAIAVVRTDGSLRTLTAIAEGGFKLHLVAATNILNQESLAQMHVERDLGDMITSGPSR